MVIGRSEFLSVLERFPGYCKEALLLSKGMTARSDAERIVVLGAGEGALAGDLLAHLLVSCPIPVHVFRTFSLPSYVNANSIAFALSTTGNEEAVLACVREAHARRASVIGITGGGRLKLEAPRSIAIPSGIHPAMTIPYFLFPMLGILYNSSAIDVKNEDINEMLTLLAKQDALKQKGEVLAKKLDKKTPLFFSTPSLEPIAHRFAMAIQQFAKTPAWHATVPEAISADLNAYPLADRTAYAPIIITHRQEEHLAKSSLASARALLEQRLDVAEVQLEGTSLLARLLYGISLAHFTAYFLAAMKRVDPSTLPATDRLIHRS